MILTPAFPQNNSTFNVSPATLDLISEELARGHELMKRIVAAAEGAGVDGLKACVAALRDVRTSEDNDEQSDSDVAAATATLATADALLPAVPFSELWAPRDFFTSYRRFVGITAHAATAEDWIAYQGVVDSSIRRFAELVPSAYLAVPCCRTFDHSPDENASTFRTTWFLGLKFPEATGRVELDLGFPNLRFNETVYNKVKGDKHLFDKDVFVTVEVFKLCVFSVLRV